MHVQVIFVGAYIGELIEVIIRLMQVMDVYMGPNGLLHSSSSLRPWLFIDSSTIDPLASRKLSLSVSGCVLKEKIGTLSEIFYHS